jgi:K+-transporting ATPase ATPase C chain
MASITSTGKDRGGLAKGAPGMLAHLRAALVSLVLLTVVTGIAYPVIVTAIAALVFPRQATGSLVVRDGKTIGSTLIGQPFDDPKYFWGRPSATSPFAYNAGASAGSNLSPTNPALVEAVRGRVEALRAADPGNTALVPVDLVTASGSGLDPHISPAAAFYQVRRVATARGLSEEKVRGWVEQHIEGRQLGFLGEPRVNVLALNLALDGRWTDDTTSAQSDSIAATVRLHPRPLTCRSADGALTGRLSRTLTKRIDGTARSTAGADQFRPPRGPPCDDALRAGSTTHARPPPGYPAEPTAVR